jgi:large subunit ribosomal protein L21
VVGRIEGKEGDKVTIKDVNLISDGNKIEIGRPLLPKAEVKATIKKQIKGDKVIAFKYKPKKRYRRKVGHRQLLTILHLDKISMK